jgi:hypothetical protein
MVSTGKRLHTRLSSTGRFNSVQAKIIQLNITKRQPNTTQSADQEKTTNGIL